MIDYNNPPFDHFPEMLKAIRNVYPSNLQQKEAYQQRNDIMKRIVAVQESGERTVWTTFLEDFRHAYPDAAEVPHMRFPNYRLKIQLPSQKSGAQIVTNRSFHVIISLLSDFYTCYWEDRYEMNEFRDERWLVSPTVTVNSFTQMIKKYPDYLEMVKTAESLMARHFPSHRYAYHFGLFTSDADHDVALPTSEAEKPPYKYFTYLFDDGTSLFNRIVWL